MTRRPLDGARRVTGDRASHAKYNPPVGPSNDYGANTGDLIRAPFNGWVTRWWSNSGGNSVAITNDDYKFTGQHLSAYAGASSGWIAEGAVIGYVGNTGNWTTGPHFHTWIERLRDRARLAFEEFLYSLGWKNTAANGGTVPGPFQTSTAGGGGTPFPDPEEPKEEEDMAQPFYYIASSNNATVTVGKGDIWVRNQPGEPLLRLTAGQAQEYFVRDGLDYNSPNVKSQPGEWFDAAFAEDAITAGYNKQAHPWMAPTAATTTGGTTDLSPVLTAVSGVSMQISEFPAPPSAEQIATAVRTKIIKE